MKRCVWADITLWLLTRSGIGSQSVGRLCWSPLALVTLVTSKAAERRERTGNMKLGGNTRIKTVRLHSLKSWGGINGGKSLCSSYVSHTKEPTYRIAKTDGKNPFCYARVAKVCEAPMMVPGWHFWDTLRRPESPFVTLGGWVTWE